MKNIQMSKLGRWLEDRRKACDMQVEEIAWQQSKEWAFDNHGLKHISGGFFSIVGASVYINGRKQPQRDQPLINQPEIGILGFLIRRSGGEIEILVQAKPEPGNLGLVHAAPAVQATESNYKRIHHGKETLFLEYFLGAPKVTVISDSLQSEEGTRFLGKYNRNMIAEIPKDEFIPESRAHKWVPIQDLCFLLLQDFHINTDARSVLVSGSWAALTPNYKPFSRWRGKGGLGEDLLSSYEASEKECVLSTKKIVDRLDRCRNIANFKTDIVRLTDLENWEITERSIRATVEADFEFRQFRIQTNEREVTHWDQPLAASNEEGQIILYAQEKKGVLHFLFNCRAEIGFHELCQYGPTIQGQGNGPFILPALLEKEYELRDHLDRSKQLLSNLHSDEGGRFYQSISRYSIRLLDKDDVVDPGQTLSWMSVKQIELLAKRRGIFSNEARSLISMLLTYL